MSPKTTPLRATDVRVHNEKIILSRIYQACNKGISQSELVLSTGLRAPTLFRIFSSLEEQGLIEIVENFDDSANELTKKGRRPVAYTTSKDALYTVGLEFFVSYISIGVFNFRGIRIFSQVESLQKNIDITETVNCIVSLVKKTLSNLNIPLEKTLGIGVAAPGQVDIKSRRVINYARILGLKNFPLVEELEKRLGISVTIHNNCSTMTLCEYRYGNYDHNGSLFAFLLRSGVGGGFVNQQGIYTSEYKTLEPGHISINYKGPSCYCGTKGCLQAYLIELDSDYDREDGGLLFNSLEQKLADGDPGAKKIIQKAADYTFLAMKSIMRFFSPRSFLILGNGERISSHIAKHIKKHWECEADVFMSNPPLIFSNTWNPLAAQRGASDLVISHYFS